MLPYPKDGVDVSLIHWMLSLTREERFASLEDLTSLVWEARRGAGKISYRLVLQTLVDRKVEFIVVGGLAMTIMGAPICAFDLELVYSTQEDNLVRLAGGRHALGPEIGPVDFLGAIGRGRTYADLLPQTEEVVWASMRLRVLNLRTIIATKEEVDGEKDRIALPILRRTLAESESQ